jgi:hypothetical protein
MWDYQELGRSRILGSAAGPTMEVISPMSGGSSIACPS